MLYIFMILVFFVLYISTSESIAELQRKLEDSRRLSIEKEDRDVKKLVQVEIGPVSEIVKLSSDLYERVQENKQTDDKLRDQQEKEQENQQYKQKPEPKLRQLKEDLKQVKRHVRHHQKRLKMVRTGEVENLKEEQQNRERLEKIMDEANDRGMWEADQLFKEVSAESSASEETDALRAGGKDEEELSYDLDGTNLEMGFV